MDEVEGRQEGSRKKYLTYGGKSLLRSPEDRGWVVEPIPPALESLD